MYTCRFLYEIFRIYFFTYMNDILLKIVRSEGTGIADRKVGPFNTLISGSDINFNKHGGRGQ